MAESIIDIPADVLANSSFRSSSLGMSSDLKINSGSWTQVATISLTEGMWIVIVTIGFATSSVGRRGISLSTSSGLPSTRPELNEGTQVAAHPTGGCYVVKTRIFKVGAAGQTVYISAFQDAGKALGISSGTYRAVRVA